MLKKRYECPHFRILVIGKANAGKTTILEKMCGVAHGTKPIVYDKDGIEITEESLTHLKSTIYRGIHDIEHQITYPGSNFIFHDSQGLEAGGVEEMERVREFIKKKSSEELRDQLHAIWYCIPMDNPCPLSQAEIEFFNQGTGKAPLVAVFTKFDAQVIQEYAKLKDENAEWDRARMNAERTFQEVYLPLVWNVKFPPKTYVQLEDMHLQESNCSQLTEKTAEAIDISSLQQLFTSVQMNNLNLCIKAALDDALKNDKSWVYVACQILSKFPHYWV
ncbi:hypothetical protein AX15_006089 [Amanita polypyramis BW_CC]|nr:hypothetical protein AX15_006089 [Amanita polypyramis BW_CC]